MCPQFLLSSFIPADWWFCTLCMPPTWNPPNELQILPRQEICLLLLTSLSSPASFCAWQAAVQGLLNNKGVYKISLLSLSKIVGIVELGPPVGGNG